jgi:hypothetical protein
MLFRLGSSEQPPSAVIASVQAFSREAEGRGGKQSSSLLFRTFLDYRVASLLAMTAELKRDL